VTLYSNEGNEAGRRHAEAANILWDMLGGRKHGGVATRRFVRSKVGWIASEE